MLQTLLTALLASMKAGSAILEVYNSEFAVEHKDDRSPLTLADKRSHQIISGELGNRYPVLSEEGKDIPYEDRAGWEYFWLVDPLDGTKEFVKRNGEFTVNIALVYRDRPVLGIIYVPVKDIFYFATKEIGAYKLYSSDILKEISFVRMADEDYLRAVLSNAVRLPLENQRSTFTVVCSRSHMSKETEEYINRIKKNHKEIDFISSGSSLKFCLVAEGLADIYPRFGPTMEWDTAAGQAIVEEAGGEVLNVEADKSLRYNKKTLLNPWFVAKMRPR